MAHGFRTSSMSVVHAAQSNPMAAQAARWAPHVEKRRHRATGYRRANCNTNGVATAQGSHDKSSVANSCGHLWCMPWARITNVFSVASKSPNPEQMAAIQNHRGD
jgi:hypothetical protein